MTAAQLTQLNQASQADEQTPTAYLHKDGMVAYTETSLIEKRNHVLQLQWLKKRDALPIDHGNDPKGGADIASTDFAKDLVTALQDVLTRRDLHAITLEFLLELERQNQETSSPRDVDAIRSCLHRITQQIERSAAPMQPMQGINEHLSSMRLSGEMLVTMQKVAGERFEIVLPTSEKSGATWNAAARPAGSISLVNRLFRDYGDDSLEPGLETIFTFRAMHAGESVLRFVMTDPDQSKSILHECEIAVSIAAPVSNVVAIKHSHPLHADNDIPSEAGG
jgi:hypothetical protein